MIARTAVVAEARRWIGTPYQHQARVIGAGVDCAGLILGVGRALGLVDYDYRDYSPLPHKGMLRRICEARFVPLDDVEAGAILLMSFVNDPAQEQHLAIHTGEDSIVHAYSHALACVEHRYSSIWRARTRQAYRYVGVE
jgi:NlpC/P60 family putative phage cell wall peptidase